MHLPIKSFLLVSTWLATSVTTLLVALWAYALVGGVNQARTAQRPQILGVSTSSPSQLAYAALPHIVSELKTAIKTQDARPVIIENYLKRYKSPMAGNGAYIMSKATELASEYHVDATYLAYLTVAIAQNESNLGKIMPPDCFNAWGYGIHSKGTLCFTNWEEGITTMMTGIARDYIAKRGLETPEEIMKLYTPHSPNGAWAKGVNQFLEDLYEGTL